MNDTNNNQLQILVQESGLEQNKVQELLSHFGVDFQEAREVVEASKDIVVIGEDQIQQMADARAARLKLQKIRSRVENTRKQMKEESLRVGKAIDGAANIIKALIIPVEEHLEKQEKFAEEMAKKRQEERLNSRVELLSPFVDDISVYDLSGMHEDTFNKLLENSKIAQKAQKEAKARAEEDRIARKKKEAEDQEKMRIENEKLRKDAEVKEKALADERAKVAKENEKQAEILRKEREEKLKLEQEIQAKKDADEKVKKEEEARIAEEKSKADEAERQRLLAPDKQKLLTLAEEIAKIEMPVVQSEKAKKAIQDISGMLGRLDAFIKQRSQTL